MAAVGQKGRGFDNDMLKEYCHPLTRSIAQGQYVWLITGAYSLHKGEACSFTLSFPFFSHTLAPIEKRSNSKAQRLILFLRFVTYSFNHMFTYRKERAAEREILSRVTLLTILSHRQGWAGATAVCLIACAMGVGSIIRAAASPPCSKPSILRSCRFNFLSQ